MPPKWFDAIATEARGRLRDGRRRRRLGRSRCSRAGTAGPANLGLGRWLVDRLGERETVRRAQDHLALAPAILRSLASSGEEGMVRALATATRLDEYSSAHAIPALLAAFPRSSRLAAAVADMAVRALRVFPRSNDHGLVHVTMNVLDKLLDGVAELLRRARSRRAGVACVHDARDRAASRAGVERLGAMRSRRWSRPTSARPIPTRWSRA